MALAVAKQRKEAPSFVLAACSALLPRGKPAGGWADGGRNSENSWILKRLFSLCFFAFAIKLPCYGTPRVRVLECPPLGRPSLIKLVLVKIAYSP